MGYMGTVYGIVAASIIHGMGEGVFTYAATIRQLASPNHMLLVSKCCTTYAELGAWALGSFASAF